MPHPENPKNSFRFSSRSLPFFVVTDYPLGITMEAIWEDLSQDEARIESPAWHEEALLETEHRLSSGQEKTVDWAEAQKELRKRFE